MREGVPIQVKRASTRAPDAFLRLARSSERAEQRMRLQRLLAGLFTHLRIGLFVAAPVLLASRFTPWLPGWLARDILFGAALQLLLGVAWSLRFRPPPLAGALALDAHHGLHGRISNALAFANLDPDARTPFMEAAIVDACEHEVELRPSDAVPFARPPHLLATTGLALAVLAIIALPPPAPPTPPSAKLPPPLQPAHLADDDLSLYRAIAEELSREDHGEQVREAATQLADLLGEMEGGQLDRIDAFRRLRAIQDGLEQGPRLDGQALEAQLDQRARALSGSEPLRPLRQAMEKRALPEVEAALRDLAKRMREQPGSFRKDDLERLRAVMKEAAGSQRERLEALEKQRREVEEEIRLRREKASKDEREERLLRRDERRLERLEREREELSQAGRQLERLDRELDRAAEDLLRELGMSAEALERGAEDVNRLAREQMSEELREQLLQRLEDLREQLRRADAGGEGDELRARLQRFVDKAKGEGLARGQTEGKTPGRGQGEGQAPGGAGLGERGEVVLQKGAQAATDGSGQASGGAGEGHEPRLLGKREGDKMGSVDVQAVGLDTGEGMSRSAVIQGASGAGFRGGGYKRVYTEYRAVAEEALRADEIPSFAKTHIRRYFDLVRPRD